MEIIALLFLMNYCIHSIQILKILNDINETLKKGEK